MPTKLQNIKEQRRRQARIKLARDLYASGLSVRDVCKKISCSPVWLQKVVKKRRTKVQAMRVFRARLSTGVSGGR